jgi:hypothetical protein
MTKKIEGDYKITPADIDVTQHFFDSFGNMETEISANWLVRMAQLHGSWRPFTRDEIQNLYAQKFPHGRYSFNHLLGEYSNFSIVSGTSYHRLDVIVEEDGVYYFTTEFVDKVWMSAGIK